MSVWTVLGVVPARGGSKGVPRKNIRLLAGKPLIAHTLLAARQAPSITRLIVSTDDPAIAEVARAWGGEVPFLRPAELAGDAAPQLDVVIHALTEVEQAEGRSYDAVVLLQPTAPLRQPADIEAALALLFQTGCDSVVSYCRVEREHPYYMVTLQDGRPQPVLTPPPGLTARQQYPPVYLRNGAIYAVRRNVLVEQRSLYGRDQRAYLMPYWRSVNIDTEFDFALAEFLLSRAQPEDGGA